MPQEMSKREKQPETYSIDVTSTSWIKEDKSHVFVANEMEGIAGFDLEDNLRNENSRNLPIFY